MPGALGLVLGVAIAGCSVPAPRPRPLPEIAEGYVRVALQVAQHNRDLVDEWRGPASWRPGPREPVAPLVARIGALRNELARTTAASAVDRDRAAYLAGQLRALEVMTRRLLGQSGTFNDEAREAFGIEPTRPNAASEARAREAVARELPGSEPLRDRYASFKRRFVVRPDRARAVMQAALAACRKATAGVIPLPADEGVELRFVSDTTWDGYAIYLGNHRSRIDVNEGGTLDVTRALRLACHEGYPGHHVQNLIIDDALVGGRGWDEFRLQPGFGPHVLITEGAAEAAADAAFPPAAREAVYRDVLLPAAGLPVTEAARLVRVEEAMAVLEPIIPAVARDYLDGRLSQSAAVDRLRDEALTPDPVALLSFAEHRRTRVLAYPVGRALLRPALGAGLAGLRVVFAERPFALQ